MDERRARLRINLAQREFEVEGSESFVAAYAERLDQLLERITERPDAAPKATAAHKARERRGPERGHLR